MKNIVISGVNLVEGGIFSVLTDCLDSIIKNGINKKHNIIVFVHKKELLKKYENQIQLIELPKSKKNWLYRLWYELLYFNSYSKKRNIDVWLSLHDITPRVKAKKQYVYCHNPTPFMDIELKNLKYDYKVFLFSLFYKYLYRINIKRNKAVIVQQEWIRDAFKQMYGIDEVIVARPSTLVEEIVTSTPTFQQESKEMFSFIYPAYPRVFKNFEIICEAASILEKRGKQDFIVQLTIDGTENPYSREIVEKYKKFKSINFVGLQDRKVLFELYQKVDAMIFPSKLETWGLPVSEFKQTEKPIILADLPYAYETIGSYEKVTFFDVNDAKSLADTMEREIDGEVSYTRTTQQAVAAPFAGDWTDLLSLILK